MRLSGHRRGIQQKSTLNETRRGVQARQEGLLPSEPSQLSSRTPERRKKEMLLRVLTHNIMLACEQEIEE
jgi:hypothetical protein